MHFFKLANGSGQGFDNPADAPAGAVEITADQFAQLATTPVVTPAMAQAQLKVSAQAALDASDLVAMRGFKAGVPFPASWQTYVAALRAIVNGTDTTSTALPTQPAYVPGT